jgi:hypothetical protein
MPSPDNPNGSKLDIDWLGIVRTVLVQVLVLLALSAAVIRYVNWTSDAAQAEFTAAGKPAASGPAKQPQPSEPVQVVKGQKVCPRKV